MSKNENITLALDCGSTNLKAALFDARLQAIARGSVPVTYSAADGVIAELDPAQLWQSTVDLIRQTCRDAAIASPQIDTLALTSQAQTFALLDPSGSPLIPFISWLDTRAEAEAAFLKEKLGPDFHRHSSFAYPLAGLQLSNLLWLHRHAPQKLAQAACIIPLPSWLTLQLAGVAAIDTNLAAMSGLYSMLLRDWWPPALELCGVTAQQMPALAAMGTAIPASKTSRDLPLSPHLKIVFAGNDHTAGAYANHCRQGTVIATLGTALVAYRFAGSRPGPFHPQGAWGFYPFGGFYELASRAYGCIALDWACDCLFPGSEISSFLTYAQAAASSAAKRQTDPAFFFPSRFRGDTAWTGTPDRDSRALAVLEGIGFALKQMIDEELQDGQTPASVCVIGGGSQSDFWLQILADIFHCPVRRGRGDSLAGAAAIAHPSASAPSQSPDHLPDPSPDSSPSQTFQPIPANSLRLRRLYDSWRKNL